MGTVPNKSYAMALCRADISSTACNSCLSSAFIDAQQLCPYFMDAAVYYKTCFVHFSDVDFTSNQNDDGELIVQGEHEYNLIKPASSFDATVGVILNATPGCALANKSRLFATGEIVDQNINISTSTLIQCIYRVYPCPTAETAFETYFKLPRGFLAEAQVVGSKGRGAMCSTQELSSFLEG